MEANIAITTRGMHNAPASVDLLDLDDATLHGYDLPTYATLKFQNGPRAEAGLNGFTLDEVLKACIMYHGALLEAFPTVENEASQKALESALATVQIRTKRRIEAGVEGTSAPEVK